MKVSSKSGKRAKPYSVELHETKEGTKLRKRYRWKIETRIQGKRQTPKYFKHGELELAETYKDHKLEELTASAAKDRIGLTEDIKESAIRCQDKLNEYGATLEEATKHYIAHLEKQRLLNKTPISKVVGNLRETKNEMSAPYQKELKNYLNRFELHFKNCPLSSVTGDQIQNYINEQGSKSSQAGHRKILNVLFNYAVKKRIIEKEDNPMSVVDTVKPKVRKGRLTIEHATNLLSHCPDEIIPAVAIMLFAGVRPDFKDGELSRLGWEHIKFNRKTPIIRLDEGITKTEQTRSVKMSDNLIAWLTPYKEAKGNIVKGYSRFRDLWEKARRDAGLFDDWISDVTRKSFATYHVALTDNEHETMTQTGHSNVSVLRNHYKSLADKEEAEAYFNIFPQQQESVVSISA